MFEQHRPVSRHLRTILRSHGWENEAVPITKWDRPFAPVQAECWDQVGDEENQSESHATAVAAMPLKTSALDSTSIENLWVTISQYVSQYDDAANVNMTLNLLSLAITLPTFTRAERNGPALEPEFPAGRPSERRRVRAFPYSVSCNNLALAEMGV